MKANDDQMCSAELLVMQIDFFKLLTEANAVIAGRDKDKKTDFASRP
jgi:hypothetical protein